jgi:hypothetical protein
MRLLRGSGVGFATVAVSVIGHVAAHAAVPSVASLVAVLVAASLVAWMLSAARWTLMSLVGVMLAVQSVLHLAFSLGTADTGEHLMMPMLSGHLAATVIMVAVLYRGEALVWAVVESLSLRVPRLLRTYAALVTGPSPAAGSDCRILVARCWHGSVPPRRGPPLEQNSLLISA